MSKKANKPGKKQAKPRVHKELNGFEVSINQFGELQTNMNIEKINKFLDENVDDKKLLEKEEKERLKKRKKEEVTCQPHTSSTTKLRARAFKLLK